MRRDFCLYLSLCRLIDIFTCSSVRDFRYWIYLSRQESIIIIHVYICIMTIRHTWIFFNSCGRYISIRCDCSVVEAVLDITVDGSALDSIWRGSSEGEARRYCECHDDDVVVGGCDNVRSILRLCNPQLWRRGWNLSTGLKYVLGFVRTRSRHQSSREEPSLSLSL